MKGFTLIELIIVMVIAAILGAIAIPVYKSSVVKSGRSAAETTLMDMAQRQQQYFGDARSYAPDVATLRYTVPTNVSSRYTITMTALAGPPPSFLVTATPIAGTWQASDGPLSIDQTGKKLPDGYW